MGLEIIIYGLYSLQQNNSIDQHHPWENDLAPGLKLHLLVSVYTREVVEEQMRN